MVGQGPLPGGAHRWTITLAWLAKSESLGNGEMHPGICRLCGNRSHLGPGREGGSSGGSCPRQGSLLKNKRAWRLGDPVEPIVGGHQDGRKGSGQTPWVPPNQANRSGLYSEGNGGNGRVCKGEGGSRGQI